MKNQFEVWGINGYVYYVGIEDDCCKYVGGAGKDDKAEDILIAGAKKAYTNWVFVPFEDGQSLKEAHEEVLRNCALLAGSWMDKDEVKIEIFDEAKDYGWFFGDLLDCEFLGEMQEVYYYAYAEPPFATDGVAYVPEGVEMADYWDKVEYEDEEDTEGDLPEGMVCVYVDGEAKAVYDSDTYIEVFRQPALTGGWGTDYPAGGAISCSSPSYYGIYGGEIRYFNRGVF